LYFSLSDPLLLLSFSPTLYYSTIFSYVLFLHNCSVFQYYSFPIIPFFFSSSLVFPTVSLLETCSVYICIYNSLYLHQSFTCERKHVTFVFLNLAASFNMFSSSIHLPKTEPSYMAYTSSLPRKYELFISIIIVCSFYH
jgi:hypothetical protein